MHDLPKKSTNYQSFLVRLWQDHPALPWRGTVQNVLTGETALFPDIDQLVAFLLRHTERPSAQPDQQDNP